MDLFIRGYAVLCVVNGEDLPFDRIQITDLLLLHRPVTLDGMQFRSSQMGGIYSHVKDFLVFSGEDKQFRLYTDGAVCLLAYVRPA
jgi:hypothetical protein